jgi:hypothetical protein
MTLTKSSKAERKAARYWGPVVGKNAQRKGPEGGDEGDSHLKEHATYAPHHSQTTYQPAGSNSLLSTRSHSYHSDDVDHNEVGKSPASRRQSNIPLRMKEDIRTDDQVTLANRDVMYVRFFVS